MAEPGDHRTAPAGGHGHLRASHADRERVIEILKDAFVQGRLTRHELDSRAGRTFASRTYAELATLTADIPAGPAAAPPPRQPARTPNRAPGSHTARDVAIGLGLGLAIVAAIVFGGLLRYTLLLLPLAACSLPVVSIFVVSAAATSLERRRSRGQLPPRPGPGGQAPEVHQPGRVGHDPALPPDRSDQARADLQSDRSRPGRLPSPGLPASWPVLSAETG